jgi:quinol monooxygenase YgiN
MITEITIIDTKSGAGDEFVQAYKSAHELLATTPGCLSARMMRSEESPDRFVGIVKWESKQHHLENFLGTDRYEGFAALLGPYVEGLPRVEHFDPLAID